MDTPTVVALVLAELAAIATAVPFRSDEARMQVMARIAASWASSRRRSAANSVNTGAELHEYGWAILGSNQ